MTSPPGFPFPPGPGGGIPPEYRRRHAGEPLGPVTMPSGARALVAVAYEDVTTVLSDPRFTREVQYEGAPRFLSGFDPSDDPDLILNMDPPRHTRLRRLMSGVFTPRQIQTWRPRVRDIVDGLID